MPLLIFLLERRESNAWSDQKAYTKSGMPPLLFYVVIITEQDGPKPGDTDDHENGPVMQQ